MTDIIFKIHSPTLHSVLFAIFLEKYKVGNKSTSDIINIQNCQSHSFN